MFKIVFWVVGIVSNGILDEKMRFWHDSPTRLFKHSCAYFYRFCHNTLFIETAFRCSMSLTIRFFTLHNSIYLDQNLISDDWMKIFQLTEYTIKYFLGPKHCYIRLFWLFSITHNSKILIKSLKNFIFTKKECIMVI